MRLSLNWLADFVELNVAPEVLADRLTMAGLEIDAIERLSPEFSGVVVGHVTAVEPHPQADRLRLAEVTTGTDTYRVVCGAPNLELGRLYPFAPIGAVVAGGQKIKAAKLRGIASEGMLCAEDELGLSQDHVGLMDIPQDLPLGADLAEALNLADVVLEVAVTANRSDCLSILGLAREVAALLDVPLRHPEVRVAPAAGSGRVFQGEGHHPGPGALPPVRRPPVDRPDREALALLDAPAPAGLGDQGHQQPGGRHQLRAPGVRPAAARLRFHAADEWRDRGAPAPA